MKHRNPTPHFAYPDTRRWNRDTSEVGPDPFWEKHSTVEPTEAELQLRHSQKFRFNQRKDIYS